MVWHRVLLLILAVIAAQLPSILQPAAVAVASARVQPATPPPAGQVQAIDKFTTTEKLVLLTFDADADAGYAPFVLDRLREKGVQVSLWYDGRMGGHGTEL